MTKGKSDRPNKKPNGSGKEESKSILEGKITKMLEDSKKKSSKKMKEDELELTPYREIILSDGSEFYIKTTCNLTSDNRVQVIQYRESPDSEGMKFLCTEPNYFESKTEFLEWLSQLIIGNFDEIPYITISPLKESDLKKHERETTEAMYL